MNNTSIGKGRTWCFSRERSETERRRSAAGRGALIRQGKIQNAGRPHAPRIRRQDLPRKPSRLPDPPPSLKLVGATPRQIARAIISSKE